MRKITEQAARAFQCGDDFKLDNTQVIGGAKTGGATYLLLHGHNIATRFPDGKLFVSSAGWETKTTKERLNGLQGVRVNQKDGVWYLNGEVWGNTQGWREVA